MSPHTFSVNVAIWSLVPAFALGAEPLAEKYLLAGKLTAGAKALAQQVEESPTDDQARVGLGVIQFLQTYEHFGSGLNKYGLRTERAFRGAPEQIRQLLPQNPKPERIGYQQWQAMLQTFVDDLAQVEETLSKVKSDDVKLPLHVALVKIDFWGTGKPVNARMLFRQTRMEVADDPTLQELVVTFDRGDVHWLRGYCHLLSALGEVLLAIDAQEHFECTAHLFFEDVESPHAFLQDESRTLDDVINFNSRTISDFIAYIHLLRFPVKQPKRLQAALGHLEAMVQQGKQMWKFIQAETDDENEWIPNPEQTGVLRIDVTQEMVDTWLATLEEFQLVLQGKKVVPFWRGQEEKRGINIRRVFTESKTIDPILWIQGTAAAPFLEEGELTKFADPRTLGQISDTFGGGLNFVGFAFWFQ